MHHHCPTDHHASCNFYAAPILFYLPYQMGKDKKPRKIPVWKYAVMDDNNTPIAAGVPRQQCFNCDSMEKDVSKPRNVQKLSPVEKRLCPRCLCPCDMDQCTREAKADYYCAEHHPDYECSDAGCTATALTRCGTCRKHRGKK